MALAYLGWSIIWVAPLATGVVALMSGSVEFVKSWFPMNL